MRAASRVLSIRKNLALLSKQELGKILKPWPMDRVISQRADGAMEIGNIIA